MKTDFGQADCNLGKVSPNTAREIIRHSRANVFERIITWFSSRLQRHRDAALLAAMDERELHDIGLYSRELPLSENVEHENQRRRIMTYDGWVAGSKGFIRRP